MTQRIFDIKNEKDIADLWDILPDEVYCIKKAKENYEHDSIYLKNIGVAWGKTLLKINWHDETEITRPVYYEDMIGGVGFFWDDYAHTHNVGVLTEYHRENHSPFVRNSNSSYLNFRPAKKSELKFWEDVE